jgi:hypothetical protein
MEFCLFRFLYFNSFKGIDEEKMQINHKSLSSTACATTEIDYCADNKSIQQLIFVLIASRYIMCL